MIKGLNPWDFGLESNSGPLLADLVTGRFIIVKIVPPKEKTIRDGLVLTAMMTSYWDSNENEVKVVEAGESPNGYEVTFPLGKRGLLATKYRGPKSFYKFKNPATNKFVEIPKENFTIEFALDYLSKTIKEWKSLSDIDKDQCLDEYFEDMYMFGLSNDLALRPLSDGTMPTPRVGMVTDFYRQYTPPKPDEKYGNTIISKFAVKEGKPNLPGDYKELPEELAIAIYNEYQKSDRSEGVPF